MLARGSPAMHAEVAVTLANLRYVRRKNGVVEVNGAVWTVWADRSVPTTIDRYKSTQLYPLPPPRPSLIGTRA
jgi:hypothetical protein